MRDPELEQLYASNEHLRRFPDSFSGTSRITKVTPITHMAGVILSDLSEVESALRSYNGELDSVPVDSGYERETAEMVGEFIQEGNLMGVDIYDRAEQIAKSIDFVGKLLMPQIKESVGRSGLYDEYFEYDAWGTNFFKTGVEVTQVGDKYVLHITSENADIELARVLGKNTALRTAEVKIDLGRVDDWWFNIDLAEMFDGIGITRAVAEQQAKYVWDRDRYFTERENFAKPQVLFGYGGLNFEIDVSVIPTGGYVRRCSNGAENSGEDWILARGNNLIGGAWKLYRSRSDGGRVTLERSEPRVNLIVFYQTEDPVEYGSRRPLILEPDKVRKLIEARDFLVSKLPNFN